MYHLFYCLKFLLWTLYPQVQDKFVLHLNDEEAVAYLQSLIDESVSAMMAALVEQFHKMAQVTHWALGYIYKVNSRYLELVGTIFYKFKLPEVQINLHFA